jgi:hypothetical protein
VNDLDPDEEVEETRMDGHHFVFGMFVISAVVFLVLRLFGRPMRLMRIMATVVFIAILVLPPTAPYLGITGLPFDAFPMFLGLPIVWWLAAFTVAFLGVMMLYEWLRNVRRSEPPVQ